MVWFGVLDLRGICTESESSGEDLSLFLSLFYLVDILVHFVHGPFKKLII